MTLVPQFPDDIFVVSDDEEARRLLLHLGLITKLTDPVQFPAGRSAFLAHKHHATHWILAARFAGCAGPADNGFLIMGWPKKDYTADVMANHVKQFWEGAGAGPFQSWEVPRDHEKN